MKTTDNQQRTGTKNTQPVTKTKKQKETLNTHNETRRDHQQKP